MKFHFFLACWDPTGITCGISDAISTIMKILTNPIAWFFNSLFPKDLWKALEGKLTPDSSVFDHVFAALIPSGMIVLAMAAVIRIVKALYDERASASNVVFDNLFRFAGGFLVLSPVGGASIVQRALDILVDSSMSVSLALIKTIGHAFSKNFGWDSLFQFMENVIIGAVGAFFLGPLGWIMALMAIVMALCVLWFGVLLIGRLIMLVFLFATAPLFVATAMYDTRNRFFQWWTELLVGTVMLPVVLGLGIGTTMGLVSLFGINPIGMFGTTAVVVGGAWFTGKMVSQLAWRHFSHGGSLMGAVGAASSNAMGIPNLAADMWAAKGALTDPGGGNLFKRLAGIPGYRLTGSNTFMRKGEMGGQPSPTPSDPTSTGAGNTTGSGGGSFDSMDSAAAAQGARLAGQGPGFDPGQYLSSSDKQVVGGRGGQLSSYMNNAMQKAFSSPGQQQAMMSAIAADPGLAAHLTSSVLPTFMNFNPNGADPYAGGAAVIQEVMGSRVPPTIVTGPSPYKPKDS